MAVAICSDIDIQIVYQVPRLTNYLAYDIINTEQLQIVTSALCGCDVLGLLPTGLREACIMRACPLLMTSCTQ